MRPHMTNLDAWLRHLDAWDRRLSAAVAADVRPWTRHAAQIGAHGGDIWLWTLLSLLLWPRLAPMRRWEWAAGLTGAAGITYLIKQQTRRRRPQHEQGLYGGGADVYSFPSGHASRWGVILAWTSGGRWRIPATLLALWTGWSRVRLGIHTLGDVLIGYAVGVAIAHLLRRLRRTSD